ncbi:hypothetical protein [Noviherbaspirillum denitrificans]|uniref:Twin-arginine translocation pathway signal protein n=1 Tax=Noviherbaspirillum denitrificans TaxID=1968433 RepID=A0A254TFT0_9BURK|nr:hypothetical protein [Noviherbaspirillum denitrificans]OWW18528.1 hypothetical protein AYR66_00270 [Noviherbaspirillum denitrificans]
MATHTSRRSFLKVGLAGILTLVAAGSLYRMTRKSDATAPFRMDDEARSVLAAVVPVMLKGAIAGSADIDAAILRIDDAIHGLPLTAQKEVQDLFALLALAPSRRLLAGVADDWRVAKAEDVNAFLQSWRYSPIALFQGAYLGLHDLITGSWYSHESTWAAIGYPGPIKELS